MYCLLCHLPFLISSRGMKQQLVPIFFFFCFALLCYHFDYLAKVLHPKNKLQALHFFNNIPNYARDAATVKYSWSKTAATPTFTGLPPHITILANFEQLELEMKATGTQSELGERQNLTRDALGHRVTSTRRRFLQGWMDCTISY
jgi:hypothetical protein